MFTVFLLIMATGEWGQLSVVSRRLSDQAISLTTENRQQATLPTHSSRYQIEWRELPAVLSPTRGAAFDIQFRPLPELPESQKPTQKPVVRMYVASWCQHCIPAKKALDAVPLPFQIVEVDVTNKPLPTWCNSIPAFDWDTPKGLLYVHWNGVQDLIGRWRQSQAERQTQPVIPR